MNNTISIITNLACIYDRGDKDEGQEQLVDNTIEVILEKNRAGARGTVKLMFQKEYNKFSSIAQFEER